MLYYVSRVKPFWFYAFFFDLDLVWIRSNFTSQTSVFSTISSDWDVEDTSLAKFGPVFFFHPRITFSNSSAACRLSGERLTVE